MKKNTSSRSITRTSHPHKDVRAASKSVENLSYRIERQIEIVNQFILVSDCGGILLSANAHLKECYKLSDKPMKTLYYRVGLNICHVKSTLLCFVYASRCGSGKLFKLAFLPTTVSEINARNPRLGTQILCKILRVNF